MAKKQRNPRVVAELGRPETPAETAARKAKDSRLYRERKTVNNLVYSLLVSLALVAVIIMLVPRGTGGFSDVDVDVPTLAAQATPSAGVELVAPEVPEGWKAKQAQLRHSQTDNLTYWLISYTTADEQYASVMQAFTADDSPVSGRWVSDQLEGQDATGSEHLGGADWTVYDHTTRDPDAANMLFGLETATDEFTLLVSGTESPANLRALAASIIDSTTTDPVTAPTEETS